MKKIVRRSQIRENFRANLIMEKEYTAQDAASDAADILIPGVSAYKNFQKGDWMAGLVDAGLDVASIAAGAFTGGAGYGAIKGATVAARVGSKLNKLNKITGSASKVADAARIAAAKAKRSRAPTTGNPWEKAAAKARFQRKGTDVDATPKTGKGTDVDATPKTGKGTAIADVAATTAGAASAFLGGGGSGSSQPLSVYGKDRPQTGFGNRMQGIDPFRSGELRQSVPFYDTTPVGGVVSRRAMMGGGIGRIPPSSLPEGKVYTQLQEMIDKSIKSKEINNILVTQDMAKNIVQLHEALNIDNKKLLEESIQSKDGFFEILDFSVRN